MLLNKSWLRVNMIRLQLFIDGAVAYPGCNAIVYDNLSRYLEDNLELGETVLVAWV